MGIEDTIGAVKKVIPLSKSGLTTVDRLLLERVLDGDSKSVIRKRYHQKGIRGYDHLNTQRRPSFRGPRYHFDTERTVLSLMAKSGRTPDIKSVDEDGLEIHIEDLEGHDLLVHKHEDHKGVSIKEMKLYISCLRDFQRRLNGIFSELDSALSSTRSRARNLYHAGISIPTLGELTFATRFIRTIIAEYSLTRDVKKTKKYRSRFNTISERLRSLNYNLDEEIKRYVDGYVQSLFGRKFFEGKRTDIRDVLSKEGKGLYADGFGLVHGDTSPGNIIVSDKRVSFIDLDSVRVDNMFIDLAYFTNSMLFCRVVPEGKTLEQENLEIIKADYKLTSTNLDMGEYISKYLVESVDSYLRLMARFMWLSKSKIESISEGIKKGHQDDYGDKFKENSDIQRVLLREIYTSFRNMMDFYLRGKGYKEYSGSNNADNVYQHLSEVEKFLTAININRLLLN